MRKWQCDTAAGLGWFMGWQWVGVISQSGQVATSIPPASLASLHNMFGFYLLTFPFLLQFSKRLKGGGGGGHFRSHWKSGSLNFIFTVIHIPAHVSLFTECATAAVPPTKWLVRGLFCFSTSFITIWTMNSRAEYPSFRYKECTRLRAKYLDS